MGAPRRDQGFGKAPRAGAPDEPAGFFGLTRCAQALLHSGPIITANYG